VAEITFNDVWKRYPDGFEAVKEMNLEVRDGEFMILVGPSGCGKSTALRMIAGLEDISEGDLVIGGERVNDLEPRDRDIAMVFQNYALYPHMTVRQNMGFALKLAKVDPAEIDRKVSEASEILELNQHLERKPANLSGGQRQRVAMGRAIVRDPKCFLMDEPLSNLDAKLRVQMRTQVARLQRQLGTTMVYVTHDQTEAMTLGDRVAVMRAGLIQQVDTPKRLYEDPANLFVAGFIGSPSMNFVTGHLEGDKVRMPFGDAPLSERMIKQMRAAGGHKSRDVIVGMRPEHFEDAAIEDPNAPDRLRFKAKIDVVESMGSELYAYFAVQSESIESEQLSELAKDAGMEDLPSAGAGGQQIVARLDAASRAAPDAELELVLDTSEIKLFDPDGGRSLTHA
jgi:multiple sugar transport system ATP-binding protein